MAKETGKAKPLPPKATAKPKTAAGGARSAIIGGTLVFVAIAAVIIVVVILPKVKPADPITFDYTNQPMLGNSHAPIKIVEFGDFKCPSCKYFHDNIFPLLEKQYIDPGEVRFYFMNFPFLGPDSTTAAEAGEAIYHMDPAAFWNYYNAIYTNQGDEKDEWATPDFLVSLSEKDVPGIDYKKLTTDLSNGTYKTDVQNDYDAGAKVGVDSTPTLFINGQVFLQFSNWNALQAAIEAAK
jgi:protein-disulfide isomerase